MNAIIDFINATGARTCGLAFDLFVQSSLLIGLLWLVDLALRRKARASVRYALSCLILLKMVLPPNVASPTSPAYWWHSAKTAAPIQTVSTTTVRPEIVTASQPRPLATAPAVQTPIPRHPLTGSGVILLFGMAGILAMAGWLWHRTRYVTQMVGNARKAPESLLDLAEQCRVQMGLKHVIEVRLSSDTTSPAVCGVVRPVILIPELLEKKLSPQQLRAVFLHELAHVKRGDAWFNSLQTLLQIAYWWHPLLWFGNAHIRRLREQATDELVMVTMQSEADVYPGTLIEVAKSALRRPFLALSLIGILESRSALKQRIHILLNNRTPASAKIGWSGLSVLALAALVLLPMARAENTQPATNTLSTSSEEKQQVMFESQFIEIPMGSLSELALGAPNIGNRGTNWILTEEQKDLLLEKIKKADSRYTVLSMPKMMTMLGQQAHFSVEDQKTVVTGVDTNRIQFDFNNETKEPHVVFTTQSMPFGQSIDVLTSLSEDGKKIHLVAIAALQSFYGYEEPKPLKSSIVVNGKKLEYTQPIPRIGKVEAVSAADIPNGGAIVLMGVETNVNAAINPGASPYQTNRQLLVLISPMFITPGGYRQSSNQAAPETVYNPVGQETLSKEFPVITAAIADSAIGHGEFSVDKAASYLKTLTNNQTIGFDKTFINQYGIKGVTLFRAGSVILGGHPEAVTGVVAARDFSKPQGSTMNNTRTFRVNTNVFEDNLVREASRMTFLKSPSLFSTLIYQLRYGNADITSNEITYTPTTGEIVIQAKPDDLDRAEAVILTLNQPQGDQRIQHPPVLLPPVLIEARFLKMPRLAFVRLNVHVLHISSAIPFQTTQASSIPQGAGESWEKVVAGIMGHTNTEALSFPRAQMGMGQSSSFAVGYGKTEPYVQMNVCPLPARENTDVICSIKMLPVANPGNDSEISRWTNSAPDSSKPSPAKMEFNGVVHVPQNGGVLIWSQSPDNDDEIRFVLLTAKRQ